MTPAYARHNDPTTSRQAAGRVNATRLERLVVESLTRNPDGLNSHEIAADLGVHTGSVTPRMKPLRERDVVCDSGQRRSRQTVWRLVVAPIAANLWGVA